jgi:hypothetical protein
MAASRFRGEDVLLFVLIDSNLIMIILLMTIANSNHQKNRHPRVMMRRRLS